MDDKEQGSDERSLIEQARQDPQAFAALYDRHVAPIYLFALRRTGDPALAEDITSATFEKALKHLRNHGWRGKSYRSWLYRIAYQQWVQNHRRNHRYVSLAMDQPANADVERQALSNVQLQAIDRAYQRLSQRDREVIALRLLDQLTNMEAAEFLRCTPENVSVRLYRALKRLRGRLEALGEFYGG